MCNLLSGAGEEGMGEVLGGVGWASWFSKSCDAKIRELRRKAKMDGNDTKRIHRAQSVSRRLIILVTVASGFLFTQMSLATDKAINGTHLCTNRLGITVSGYKDLSEGAFLPGFTRSSSQYIGRGAIQVK